MTPCYVIKKVPMMHCKRGTMSCEKCRAAYQQKYCLLNICPEGDYARPMIQVEINGTQTWRVYDVAKVFKTPDEALDYATANKIEIYKDTTIESDEVLNNLKKNIPAGWSFIQEAEKLIIRRKEAVFVLFENRINAPFSNETTAERDERIKKNGKKVYPEFVFALEAKWYQERIKKVMEENKALYEQINALPKKHNIEHLYDANLSRKGNEIYSPTNKQEKISIMAYTAEKDDLLNKIQKLPDYQSQYYNLYLVSTEGMENEFNVVAPQSASEEMYKLDNLIKDFFKK